jgi:hypothetical protein
VAKSGSPDGTLIACVPGIRSISGQQAEAPIRTSGARPQLALAPAGAGKTTAMRAITLAWTEDSGQLLGFAPSAAAAR